jgi:hypothetical protein
MAGMPSVEEIRRLRRAVAAPKVWVAGVEMGWVLNGAGPPPGHKFRAPLAYAEDPEIQSADLFVGGYYKDSNVPGVPPKFSIGLFCSSKRVVGIDDGGPSCHYNEVGRGLPYYQARVGHPQLHLIADDSIYGYAEPLEPGTPILFWELFLELANIEGAPSFSLPEGQMEMDL